MRRPSASFPSAVKGQAVSLFLSLFPHQTGAASQRPKKAFEERKTEGGHRQRQRDASEEGGNLRQKDGVRHHGRKQRKGHTLICLLLK